MRIDVIPDFTVQDILEDRVSYPVFVKPSDNRGSRGQSVCYNREQALAAVKIAQKASSTGNVIIEKSIQHADEVQVTYFFVNGRLYLLRTVDSYRGSESDRLEIHGRISLRRTQKCCRNA